MIPLYGFLQGDTIGILILADEDETLASIAGKLQASASVRVAPRDSVVVLVAGAAAAPDATVRAAGLTPLDRFDVIAAVTP